MATYKEMTCTIACNKLKRKIPYSWDLNIYRGCEHGCKYCYAIYSHQYLNSKQYFDDIYVKTNIVEQLEKQFSSPTWKREVVNINGVTDSYQPIEAKYQLMPEILRLLIKYKTPCIISTKSDLINKIDLNLNNFIISIQHLRTVDPPLRNFYFLQLLEVGSFLAR